MTNEILIIIMTIAFVIVVVYQQHKLLKMHKQIITFQHNVIGELTFTILKQALVIKTQEKENKFKD